MYTVGVQALTISNVINTQPKQHDLCAHGTKKRKLSTTNMSFVRWFQREIDKMYYCTTYLW